MNSVDQTTPANRLQQLLYTLGRAYLQKEQYAEAFDKFNQLLAMDGDNSEILLDTAIAALGLNDAAESTLNLYEKAVAQNPDSLALKLGLASLFVHHNITTPFAIEICQSAAELAPANEMQIRLHLKRYYETAGLVDKADAEEQKAVFNSRDSKAIRAYLEKLWWEGKFSEALAALRSAPTLNGAPGQFANELALTHAYELLCTRQPAQSMEIIKTILTAAASLAPAYSLLDLRDYLTLRLSLLRGTADNQHQSTNIEEHQFILGTLPLEEVLQARNGEGEEFVLNPFDLRQEVLESLTKPAEWLPDKEVLDGEWQGFLFTQIATQDGKPVPDRLRDLLSSHLAQMPNTLLRQSGAGFISLAQDPIMQLRAMVDFMQSLEEYNAAVSEPERVTLMSGLQATRLPCKCNDYETLVALVEAAHLLRIAELTTILENSGGTLLLRTDDEDWAKVRSNGINLMLMESVRLLPGKEISCAEVVWRNPLAQFKDGQIYNFGRFEIRKRLLKHNSYGTYLANDVQLDRPVVTKVMLPSEAARFLQNEEQRRRLLARVRAVARLSHPHLAYIYDIGEHEGMFYFTREYVEGKNLGELNFRDDQCDGEILVMLQKIVRALLYANSKNITHLNLKPGNIWLSEAQELKITDFRIPGFAEDGSNSNVLFPAHWRYAAPEILLGESGDSRSDIYSVGIIAYELIAGHHPYNTAGAINSPKDIFKARIAPLSDQEKPHHKAWDDFVMKAIQREAAKRFPDLTEMDQELRNIQMEMLKKALTRGDDAR